LIEYITDDGDIADPKILLDSVTRLTDKIELLAGRATSRTEVDERVHYDQVREELMARLDDLAARNYRGIARTGTDNALPSPGGPDIEVIEIPADPGDESSDPAPDESI